MATAQTTILCNEFENYTFKIITTSVTDQWVIATAGIRQNHDALFD